MLPSVPIELRAPGETVGEILSRLSIGVLCQLPIFLLAGGPEVLKVKVTSIPFAPGLRLRLGIPLDFVILLRSVTLPAALLFN